MPKPIFSEIFGSFPETDTVNNSIVENCRLDIEARSMDVTLSCDLYIGLSVQRQINDYIKNTLKLEKSSVSFLFPQSAFCIDAGKDIAEEIRLKNAPLNGYLNGAVYVLEGDILKINLKHGGYKKILDCGFQNAFISRVKELFGREITVEFDGQLEDEEFVLPEAEPPKFEEKKKPQKEATKETKISFEKRKEKPQNGIVYLDDPKIFYGRRIDNNTKPMIEVSDEDTEISCWGEVFATESRTINTKRGEAVIFTFSFSDYTNSLTASMFMDPKRMGNIAPIKKGNFILVNGIQEFDNYKKEFILKPRAIAQIQKYTETDDYEGEKRVELHCHTNMSSKDAVSPAEDIINQAYNWGHKAVAITDHGVVQSFPAAAGAVKGIRKKGGDFKVIYGV